MALYQVVKKDGVKTLEGPIDLCCGKQQALLDDAIKLTVELKQGLEQDLFTPVVLTVADKIAAGPFTVTVTGGQPQIAALALDHYEIEYNSTVTSNTTVLLTLDATGVAVGTELTIKARAVDTLGNASAWVTATTTVSEVTINAPTIVVPANGAEVSASETELLVTTSPFTVVATGLPDTHAHTVFTLKKDNAVVATYEAGAVTQYKFTGLTLDAGDYTVEAYFIGASGAQSPVGKSEIIVKAAGITAPGGQKLAMNATGDGVLVWYTEKGIQKLMAVALANQRGNNDWMSDGMSNYWDINTLPNLEFSGDVTIDMSDAQIDALSGSDPNTAKSNTDKIVTALSEDSASSAAAIFCRRKMIAGHTCSLPNMNQSRRIYALQNIIDEIDSTAASYPAYKLSNWGFKSGIGQCWSSSERNAGFAWVVESDGFSFYDYKERKCGVIPILELNPETLQPI